MLEVLKNLSRAVHRDLELRELLVVTMNGDCAAANEARKETSVVVNVYDTPDIK